MLSEKNVLENPSGVVGSKEEIEWTRTHVLDIGRLEGGS